MNTGDSLTDDRANIPASPEPEPMPDAGMSPPVLSDPAAAEPPLLSDFERPPAEAPPVLGGGLMITWIVTGVVQLLLALPASRVVVGESADMSRRIGAVLGSTVIWPLVIIGLFAIGRRFRTTRTRQTIMIVVWSIFILSNLANLGSEVRRRVPVGLPLHSAGPGLSAQPEPLAVQRAVLAPLPVVDEGTPLAYDFSPGSDERLIASIESAQKERYQAVVAEYVRACERRPADAVLALERVRFIERFVYSEEVTIEGAEEDHEAALLNLNTRFPRASGTLLHELRQTAFSEVEAKAAKYAGLTVHWPVRDRAEFLLLRANAANAESASSALGFARESFTLNPTIQAGLLLAEKLQEKNERVQCLEVLMHPVFADAEAWPRKRKLDLLLKIGEAGPASSLYAELKADPAAHHLLRDPETASSLAKAGRIMEAREVFTGIAGGNDWLRERGALRHFAFELEHGDKAQAEAAYRALRAGGFTGDPVSRYRYALFRHHPGAGWQAGDFVGFILLGVISILMILLPLMLMLPAHYWSLLRERKGKTGGWPDALWGLRQAWLLLGTLFFSSIIGLWFMSPEEMRSWFTDIPPEPDVLAVPSLLSVQLAIWFCWVVLVAGQLVYRQAWQLYRPATWGLLRCLLIGAGAALAGRFCLGVFVKIWPEAAQGEVVAALSQTAQLGAEILSRWGPFGLLTVVAVFVPVLEETMFRGIVLQGFGKHVPFGWANAIQAALFACIHENLNLFPFYFGLGFVCGELTRRSGSLLPAITLHVVNNGLSCLVVLAAQRAAGS